MLLLESCCHCYCQPFVFLYCLRGEYLKYIYVCAYVTVYKWLKSSIGRRLCYRTQNVWSLSYSCSSDGGKPRAWTLWRQVMPKTEKWTLTYNLCQTMRVTFPFVDVSPGPGRWVTSSDWQVMKWASSKSSKRPSRHLQSAFLLQNKKGSGQNKQFLSCYISSRAEICFCYLKGHLKIYSLDEGIQGKWTQRMYCT